MSNDPTTPDDEKSVHQQCIDDPGWRDYAARDEPEPSIEEALQNADDEIESFRDQKVLAAEVRRLRVLNHEAHESITAYAVAERNLMAEVRRLREIEGRAFDVMNERNGLAKYYQTALADIEALREASRVTAINFGKAQLEIARLQTKLARVEALPMRWRTIQPPFDKHSSAYEKRCVFEQLTEELEAALRDPQPSAAPTPKGEPYNGY